MSQSIRTMPDEQQKALRRARWLQAIWIVVLATIVAAIYFSLGNSQAMRTAWIEDMLSFVPPVAFLVGSWIEGWKPNRNFPLGYIRVTSIAYLISAVALGGEPSLWRAQGLEALQKWTIGYLCGITGAVSAPENKMPLSYDFAAQGWDRHDDRGFLGIVGPVWQRQGFEGPELAFQATEKHENLRGVVQGGMLMTLTDRMLGAIGRWHNNNNPQATVQLNVQFLAPVRIGAVVVGRGTLLRNTRTLMFLRGELVVDETPVVAGEGVWKKLETE